jgi:subtilisin family serine protease
MKVTVTTYLNRRVNEPKLLPDNKSGQLSPGDTIDVAETLQGDEFEGTNLWLKDTNGNYFWSGGTDYATLTQTVINYADKIVNMPQVWETGKGRDIVIALLDSGITNKHPALQAILAQYKRNEKSFSTTTVDDVWGHATGLAGLMAGITPSCNLLTMKVLNDDGVSTGKALADGLDAIMNLLPTVKTDIINLSLDITKSQYQTATYSNGETIETKINKLVEADVVIIAAAGNGQDLQNTEIYFPAINKNVIAIGASSQLLDKTKINPAVDFIYYDSVLQTAGIDGAYNATIHYTSAYTAVTSALAAAILAAGVLPAGTAKKDFVVQQLKNISISIDNFKQPSNSEITIYKIN